MRSSVSAPSQPPTLSLFDLARLALSTSISPSPSSNPQLPTPSQIFHDSDAHSLAIARLGGADKGLTWVYRDDVGLNSENRGGNGGFLGTGFRQWDLIGRSSTWVTNALTSNTKPKPPPHSSLAFPNPTTTSSHPSTSNSLSPSTSQPRSKSSIPHNPFPQPPTFIYGSSPSSSSSASASGSDSGNADSDEEGSDVDEEEEDEGLSFSTGTGSSSYLPKHKQPNHPSESIPHRPPLHTNIHHNQPHNHQHQPNLNNQNLFSPSLATPGYSFSFSGTTSSLASTNTFSTFASGPVQNQGQQPRIQGGRERNDNTFGLGMGMGMSPESTTSTGMGGRHMKAGIGNAHGIVAPKSALKASSAVVQDERKEPSTQNTSTPRPKSTATTTTSALPAPPAKPHHPLLISFLSSLFPYHTSLALTHCTLLEIIIPFLPPIIGALIDLPPTPIATLRGVGERFGAGGGRRRMEMGKTVYLELPAFSPRRNDKGGSEKIEVNGKGVGSGPGPAGMGVANASTGSSSPGKKSSSPKSSPPLSPPTHTSSPLDFDNGLDSEEDPNPHPNIDIRDHLTSLLDLVSECLDATELVLVLNRNEREDDELRELLHALAYVGGGVCRRVKGGFEWDEREWVLVGIEV